MVDFAAKLAEAVRDRAASAAILAREPDGSHFSASQHKTKKRCDRFYWFERIAKVKDHTPKIYFATGKALHGVAERYHLKQATSWEGLFPPGWAAGLDDENRRFVQTSATAAVEKGIWQATDDVEIEAAACALVGKNLRDARGMPLLAKPVLSIDEKGERVQGRPTCLADGSPLPDQWDRLPRFVAFLDVKKPVQGVLEDHKSAKNRRYTLTPDKLARDVQMLSYAAILFAERPSLNVITLKHNVFLKDVDAPERVYATTTTVTPVQVARHWEDVIATVEAIRDLRIRVPIMADGSPGGGEAENRADRWLEVPGAADEGDARKKESCESFGGCPYKPVCFGQCTAKQLVHRLDATKPRPGAPAPGPPPAPRPSLIDRMTKPKAGPIPVIPPPPTPKQIMERLMPFPKPVLQPGTDCYILDPDNLDVQYRVKLLSVAGTMATVSLFPNVDVLPDHAKLSDLYRTEVPFSLLLPTVHITAKLTGYHEALLGAGHPPEAATWVTSDGKTVNDPAQAGSNPFPAGATGVSRLLPTHLSPQLVPGNPPILPVAAPAATTREIAPGITQTTTPGPTAPTKGAAMAAQQDRALAAEKAAIAEMPKDTFLPVRNMLVRVLPTDHKFWSKMVGQTGVVVDITVGEGGQTNLLVQIEDQEFTVALGRFEPVVEPSVVTTSTHAADPVSIPAPSGPTAPLTTVQPEQASVTIPAGVPGTEMPNEMPQGMTPALLAHFTKMVGKIVRALPHTGSPVTGILEAADMQGITMISGQIKYAWDQIKELIQWDGAIPGAVPAKLSKEEKAAAKAARAAEDAKTEQEAAAKARAVNLPMALGQALDAMRLALSPEGKVTRKVLEGILPLLEQAMEYHDAIRDQLGRNAFNEGLAIDAAKSAPRPQEDQVINLVRSQLRDARDALEQAQAELKAALATVTF